VGRNDSSAADDVDDADRVRATGAEGPTDESKGSRHPGSDGRLSGHDGQGLGVTQIEILCCNGREPKCFRLFFVLRRSRSSARGKNTEEARGIGKGKK